MIHEPWLPNVHAYLKRHDKDMYQLCYFLMPMKYSSWELLFSRQAEAKAVGAS